MEIIVPETDVLWETCRWLLGRCWRLTKISPPSGQDTFGNGIDTDYSKGAFVECFKDWLLSEDLSRESLPAFSNSGVDIEAENNDNGIIWRIECKGAGTGQSQTLRNNFDRALSSVVTYWDDLPNDKSAFQLRLGLALPNHKYYMRQIRRIPERLRRDIQLWLLIYDSDTRMIQEYGLDKDIRNVF